MLLHQKLQAIAQGESYHCSALYDALEHPVTTSNDRQMLHRYMHGAELLSDRIRLQELAIYIYNFDSEKV